MGVNANVTMQNGSLAASNVNTGGNFYMDPGNALTFALQSNTGVQTWVLSFLSDYGPLNGAAYTLGPSQTLQLPLPLTPCKLTVSSEVTDGNNVTQATFFVYNYGRATSPDRAARYVVTSNVNLSAFNTNATYDGITPIAGDRVLCVGQANLSQNGPYVVGTPAANVAVLTRPGDFATGQVMLRPATFEISEGTSYGGSSWKDMNVSNGVMTVDTTNASYFPRVVIFNLSNIANSLAATANSFIWTNAQAVGCSANTTNAVRIQTINAGLGTGNVTASCTSANDGGRLIVFNW